MLAASRGAADGPRVRQQTAFVNTQGLERTTPLSQSCTISICNERTANIIMLALRGLALRCLDDVVQMVGVCVRGTFPVISACFVFFGGDYCYIVSCNTSLWSRDGSVVVNVLVAFQVF